MGFISTHTPTQGVTKSDPSQKTTGYNFYSHAHAGRDLIQYAFRDIINIDFYSHAHAGRDRMRTWLLHAILDFYSHAHAGRDHRLVQIAYRFNDFYSHAHAGRDPQCQK